jgi:regulator of protease activity HflC (stomatin/prohibitin superfamily)
MRELCFDIPPADCFTKDNVTVCVDGAL